MAIARAGWPVRSASASAVAERYARSAPTTAPRTCRALPSNGDCRRPDGLPVRPAARNRQWDASGQSPQRGAGRQKTRPRSINAWFHSPGADRVEPRLRVAASRSGATSSGSAPWIARAVTLRTLVSIAATGSPWPIDATAAAVYGPTPGRPRRAIRVSRHPAVVVANDRCGPPRGGRRRAGCTQVPPRTGARRRARLRRARRRRGTGR